MNEHVQDGSQDATASSRVEINFLGYTADRPLTSANTIKDGAYLWTSGSGGAGIIFFTGSYWSVRCWKVAKPKEQEVIKSRLRSVRPWLLPHLGVDCHIAAFEAWHGRVKPVLATEKQVDYLAKLGPAPPKDLPAMVAEMAIPLLRTANDLRLGRAQMPDCFAPVLNRVEAAATTFKESVPPTIQDYWNGLLALDREVFRRAE